MPAEAAVPISTVKELARQIAREEIAKYARSGPLRNATISGGSGLTVKDGGIVRLQTADGVDAFYIGPVDPDLPDGSRQPGWVVRRADGSIVLMLWDPRPDLDGYSQFLGWYDRQGHAVITDDTVSGFGIARPHLAHAFYPARAQDFPKVTASSFETIYRARVEKQQPRLYVESWGGCDTADTTGQVQVTVNDVVWGAPKAATSGVTTGYSWGPAPIDGNFGDMLRVEVQAKRTAGTGNVQVGASWVTGWQS